MPVFPGGNPRGKTLVLPWAKQLQHREFLHHLIYCQLATLLITDLAGYWERQNPQTIKQALT